MHSFSNSLPPRVCDPQALHSSASGTAVSLTRQVVATPLARLRKVALSKPKALYIQGLAADIVAKKVNFHRFPKWRMTR